MIRPSGDRVLFLRKSIDIERVKKHGRRFQTTLFNMLSCPSGSPRTRIGIVVGKRFGGAVNRNRAKRVFRELVREVRQQLVAGHELLVFPRREALIVRHRLLQDAWKAALRHEGLMIAELDQRCDNSASV
ncbi:MAG: ribonuclease P protein component [Nitrospiraceae bacterium]